MPKMKFMRIDLAARQLETAIWMYLTGKDRLSVITLAGASSGILTQLVLNAGKQPFVDYGREFIRANRGEMPKRESYKRHVNLFLGVDLLKHHSPKDAPTFELDEEEAAVAALTRAVVDYIDLRGQKDPWVIRFLNWLWKHHDGPRLMELYNALPKHIRKLKK